MIRECYSNLLRERMIKKYEITFVQFRILSAISLPSRYIHKAFFKSDT